MAIPKKPTTSSRTSTTRNVGLRNDSMNKAELRKAIMQKGNIDKPIIKKAEPVAPTTRAEPTKVASSAGNGDEEKLYSPSLISMGIMVVIIVVVVTMYFFK